MGIMCKKGTVWRGVRGKYGPMTDAEWRTKSIIGFKVSEGVRYIWASRTGPPPLEFNHFNVRLCPGASKVVPVKETFFSCSHQKHKSTFAARPLLFLRPLTHSILWVLLLHPVCCPGIRDVDLENPHHHGGDSVPSAKLFSKLKC